MGAALDVQQARQGRKQRKKANAITQKQARLQAGRQAIEQVRQAQIARAQVIQQAESTGAGDSSAVAGAVGSIQSQAGSNIAFAQQLFSLSQQANNRLQKASDFEANSKAITKLKSTIFSAAT